MNLVKFLVIAALFSILLGELGKYPFGMAGSAVSLTDFFMGLSLVFFIIWQFGIKKNYYFHKAFINLSIFYLVGFLSLFISQDFRGVAYLIRFILYSSSFLIGVYLIKDKVWSFLDLIKMISLIGLIFSLLGFLQLIFFPDLTFLTFYGYDPHQYRLTSTFLDPNFAGAFLNIALLLSSYIYKTSKKKEWLIVSLILLVAIILTFSRSAYLQLFVEFIIFLYFINKKLLIPLVLIPVILYFSVPRFNERINGLIHPDVTANERFKSWNKGLTIFERSPIFGVGFNNLRYVSENDNLIQTYTPDGGNSGSGLDSSFLFVLTTTGIIGFSVFIFWWIFILKSIYKKSYAFVLFSLVFGLFIDSQFINSLFYPSIMLVIYLILGAAVTNESD